MLSRVFTARVSRGERGGGRIEPVPFRRESDVDPSPALRYHAKLFEYAPDAYLTTDASGCIRDANLAAAALLRASRESLRGRHLGRLVCPAQRHPFERRLTRLGDGVLPRLQEWQVRLQPERGEPIEASLSVAALPSPEPTPPRLLWGLRNITRRKKIEKRLKESEEQYRSLYRRMVSQRDALRILSHRYLHAREEEAQRIAHQLHDEAGQVTASIHLALDEIALELPRRSRMRLRQAKAYLDDIEERLRRLSHELRPTILDDLGLVPALEFLAEGLSGRSGIALRVSGTTGGRLDAVVETAVYRIVQEALANVGRHALARHASIRLERRGDILRCRVEDDGVGFDTAALAAPRRGLGLLGVRERLDALGGSLRVQSTPGRGTRLSIAVPVRSGS